MTSFHAIEDSSRDFAALYLVGVTLPGFFRAPVDEPISLDTPFWIATGVLGLGLTVDTWRAIQLMASFAQRELRGLGRRARLPGSGLALWALDLVAREPLIDPEQARESLASLCGYRLRGEGYRVISIVPSLHRWRIGVWVSLGRPSAFTRRWECRYVRWVDDPHELRLLRSAVGDSRASTPAAPRGASQPIALDDFNGDEIDELLAHPNPRRPGTQTPTP